MKVTETYMGHGNKTKEESPENQTEIINNEIEVMANPTKIINIEIGNSSSF